jgi:polysaccharide export outer membrane protein
MTLRQALAQAGGPTQRGTERSLRLHRRSGEGEAQKLIKNPNLDGPARAEDVLHVGESIF